MSRIDVKNGNGFYFVDVYAKDTTEDLEDTDDKDVYGPEGTFRICKETGKVTQIYTEHKGHQRFLFYVFILIVGKKLDRKQLTTTDPGFIHFLQWKCKIYHHGPIETPVWIDMNKIDIEKIIGCDVTDSDLEEFKIVMV